MTWVIALGDMASQWPAPSPDRYLNIDAPPAVTLVRLSVLLLSVWHCPSPRWEISVNPPPPRRPQCPHCWSRSRCVRVRARAAVSGEDARARLPISSLHPGVWPPRRRDWALCRRTSARTRRRETWRPLQSEGGKSRIPERPFLQVDFFLQRSYLSRRFPPFHSRLLLSAQRNLISICRPLRLSTQNWVRTRQQWCYISCMM